MLVHLPPQNDGLGFICGFTMPMPGAAVPTILVHTANSALGSSKSHKMAYWIALDLIMGKGNILARQSKRYMAPDPTMTQGFHKQTGAVLVPHVC